MKLNTVINSVTRSLKRNSPAILSSTAIIGVVSTAYLASKATLIARDKIKEEQDLEAGFEWVHRTPMKERQHKFVEEVKLCWKIYIPTAISGTFTIVCIIGTTRVSNKRAAAAQAAFVLSERAYSEYRSKVIEEYGERKDQSIRDSIAQDRVTKNTPPTAEVLFTGPGNVLCCELLSGRYFASDMEALRRAQNDLNSRLLGQDACTLDDFYFLIGVNPTSHSGDLGWNSEKLMELEFSTVLTEDGRPCLAFEYNYIKPIYEGLYG